MKRRFSQQPIKRPHRVLYKQLLATRIHRPPYYLHVDQGTNYGSKEFKSNAEAAGITIREATIGTPGAIGTVERYHAPLRAAYYKIKLEGKRNCDRKECLEMAVFEINCTIGPEGLWPVLKAFGAIPRPARQRSSATKHGG